MTQQNEIVLLLKRKNDFSKEHVKVIRQRLKKFIGHM